MKKYLVFLQKEWVLAGLLALSFFGLTHLITFNLGGDYYGRAAMAWLQTGIPFVQHADAMFHELIPTSRGFIFAYPPLPFLLMIPFQLMRIHEIELARLAGAAGVALMYIVARQMGAKRKQGLAVALIYGLTTPLTRLVMSEGSWYTAQLLSAMFAQLSYLEFAKKRPLMAGIWTGLALNCRLSMAVGIFLGYGGYYLYKRQLKNILMLTMPLMLAVVGYGYFNYYRFGNWMESGYTLIPSVLLESYYRLGIMNVRYAYDNLKRYLWQYDYHGQGLGIVWAQPYLWLCFWRVPKQARLMLLVGLINFAIVLCHGGWGWVQYDFRFLLDSYWAWIPSLALLPKQRWHIAAVLALIALAFHLPLLLSR